MSTPPSLDRLGPIDLVTIVVPSLDRATNAYADGLGLQLLARCRCPDALALALGRVDLVGAGLVGVGMPGRMLLRLIESPNADPSRQSSRPGWRAVALRVADVDTTFARAIEAGFAALAAPASGAREAIVRAAEVVGPASETIRLEQIAAATSPVRAAAGPEWSMAIACSDQIEQARGFYEGLLGGSSWLEEGPAPSDPGATLRSAVVDMPGGSMIRIEARPSVNPARSDQRALNCGLLSVRLGRGGPSAADESQLIRNCRVLAGAEGELIELL